MEVTNNFYILYVQNTSEDKRTNRLVVFYSLKTLEPIVAFDLDSRHRIPKDYFMLEHITITLKQYRQFKRRFTEMGIMQDKGRAIAENIFN